MWQITERLDRLVEALLRYALVLTLLAMLAILGLAIIMRAASSMDIGAYQEIIALLCGWMIFLGAVSHIRDGTMFAVELPWGRFGRGAQLVAHFLANLLVLCFSIVMAVWG
jgi:TRAP-type C4-dicarboxylate transport system permease small subunit